MKDSSPRMTKSLTQKQCPNNPWQPLSLEISGQRTLVIHTVSDKTFQKAVSSNMQNSKTLGQEAHRNRRWSKALTFSPTLERLWDLGPRIFLQILVGVNHILRRTTDKWLPKWNFTYNLPVRHTERREKRREKKN